MRKIGIITPVTHLPGVYELIRSKGEVVFNEPNIPTTEEAAITIYESGVDTLICNPNKQTFMLNEETLNGSKVKTIVTCSTGISHIDLSYCYQNNIDVYSLTEDPVIHQLPSTAELAFTLMCNLLRKITEATDHVKRGGWNYEPFIGRQIKDLTIGIVGFGRLGKMMCDYCEAFGAKTLVYDPYEYVHWLHRASSIEQLFKQCDVVSLHVHLNEETEHMINEELLTLPTKQFYLVNTSRGGIVNEDDVVKALASGKLAGYATDVLEGENSESRILSPITHAMKDLGLNIIITPHIGGMTWEGQELAYKTAINKL